MVGFAADGASTMFGSKHSVKVLFENDIPNLYAMKCICHSLALVASYATQKIPDSIEKLVRDIYKLKDRMSTNNFNHFVM